METRKEALGNIGKIETSEETNKSKNDLTISTKLSTDQLICERLQDSPNTSINSFIHEHGPPGIVKNNSQDTVLYLGTLQILFGLLMVVFGVLVTVYGSSLSKIGVGLWGGCLAIVTGVVGVSAAAKDCCPLKESARRVARTMFLALSLISLSVSHLGLVLAATGLLRDANSTDMEDNLKFSDEAEKARLPDNCWTIMSNVGLLVVSSMELLCAAVSSYKSARDMCPCFERGDFSKMQHLSENSRDALVNSWLGKHTPPPLMYVVASPGTTHKTSKMSGLAPIFTLPPVIIPPQPPPIIRVPLIPAPLGQIPSPIIPPAPPKKIMSSRHRICQRVPTREHKPKSKQRKISAKDVTQTYTGLDRIMAEEFIEICDSRNNSLCSNSSFQNSCESSNSSDPHSDIASQR